jgi:hypothetical protein
MPKTNTPQVKIVNIETGEEIIRDATVEEIAQMELDSADSIARKATAEAEAEAKATSRQAILDRLGLTAEEAKLLLGGN